MVEFDIHRAFDELRHTKVLRMVRMHVKERWAVLYIERLAESALREGGRHRRPTHSGGAARFSDRSGVDETCSLHFAFDRWMQEIHPYAAFARYADDAVVHCVTEKQAQYVLGAIGRRLLKYGLKTQPAEIESRLLQEQSSHAAVPVQAVHLPWVHHPTAEVSQLPRD